MRRWHFLFAFLFFVTAIPAKAKDFYVTQAGKGTGVSCSNPLSVAWFNNVANWGTGVRQIGPGTTAHLCGTFTGGVGQQLLTVRRSGTSSYPITIKFESGAKLNSPAWSGLGAINAANLSYIVVDGGGTGVIQNTANGTGRANRRSSVAIYFAHCTGCKVKNLTIANLYVHSSTSDTTVNQGQVNCVNFVNANNMTIDHLTCHDAGWALAGMGNNFTLQYSIIYNIDHGLAFGAAGTTSGFSIHDNHIYNFANWDTTTNKYHHDGIHMWGQNGGRVTNGSIYNNRFDGDSGVNITGFIFLQDSIQHVAVYNNVFTTPSTRVMRSIWFHAASTSLPGGSATYNSAHNNTANAGTHREGSGLMAEYQLNFSAYNNVLMGGQSDVSVRGGTISGMNNNVYVDLASFGDRNTFGWNGTTYQTLTQWKGICRCDGSSRFVTPSQVTFASTGQITGTSAAVGTGTNLTSISNGSLSMLASDIIGAARPASGSWDAGAYQTGSTPTKPAPVSGVTATVQ